MDRASTRDRLRAHCGAVSEAVLASIACVNERSQSAAKIFSEDRPRHCALLIAKIAPFTLGNDHCIAHAAGFPDGSGVSFVVPRLKTKTTPSGRIRTRASSRPVQRGVLRLIRLGHDARAGAERRAQRRLVPQGLAGRRTRARTRPGRQRPLVVTPRGHLRPDKVGRERPPFEGGRGRLAGVAEGVAHAPRSPFTIIRAASAAAENAVAFAMTATAHPLVSQRVAASATFTRRHRLHRRSGVQRSGLKGTTQIRGVVPPFVPRAPLRGLR
jgi:hypothetical protein